MTRRIARIIALIIAGLIVDLAEAAACLVAVGALTVLLGLVIPLAAAFVIALLTVCTLFGYRRAQTREGDPS